MISTELSTIPINYPEHCTHQHISASVHNHLRVQKHEKPQHITQCPSNARYNRKVMRIENYGSEGEIDENSVCVYCWNVFVVKWICSFSCYLFYSFWLYERTIENQISNWYATRELAMMRYIINISQNHISNNSGKAFEMRYIHRTFSNFSMLVDGWWCSIKLHKFTWLTVCIVHLNNVWSSLNQLCTAWMLNIEHSTISVTDNVFIIKMDHLHAKRFFLFLF